MCAIETQTLNPPSAFFLNTLSQEERLLWLRQQDAVTPCGALLVLSIVELSRPSSELNSLTSPEVTAYFDSGYEVMLLSSVSCAEGTEHRFLLKKHHALNPILIAESLLLGVCNPKNELRIDEKINL